MTLRIERGGSGRTATLRVIGRLQSEHLEELWEQVKGSGAHVELDLAEVTLVDLDAVRFLGRCESAGVRVLGCAPYIRDWIAREREALR